MESADFTYFLCVKDIDLISMPTQKMHPFKKNNNII